MMVVIKCLPTFKLAIFLKYNFEFCFKGKNKCAVITIIQ